jgi:hypothetical protein
MPEEYTKIFYTAEGKIGSLFPSPFSYEFEASNARDGAKEVLESK